MLQSKILKIKANQQKQVLPSKIRQPKANQWNIEQWNRAECRNHVNVAMLYKKSAEESNADLKRVKAAVAAKAAELLSALQQIKKLQATPKTNPSDWDTRDVGQAVPVINVKDLKAKINQVAKECQTIDEDTCYTKFKAIAKLLLAESKQNQAIANAARKELKREQKLLKAIKAGGTGLSAEKDGDTDKEL